MITTYEDLPATYNPPIEQTRDKERISPEIRQMLLGNEAMVRIRWKEAEEALKILDRNLKHARADIEKKGISDDNDKKFLLRTYYDRILALR